MHPLSRYSAIAVCLILTIFAANVDAAGFDCSKAKSSTEKTICGDPMLSTLDSEMAALYGRLIKGDDKHNLALNQKNWLHNVRDVCSSVECLKAAYTEHIAFLQNISAQQSVCTLPKPPEANKSCTRTVACAENFDHTFFQVTGDVCGEEGTGNPEVKVYRHANKTAPPVLVSTLTDVDGMQAMLWGMPDRNGYAELEITVACGAGPNCSQYLYRYDPDTKSIYHYFSGGYSDLSYFDGYLLESGRGSCCEWELHVHKIHQQGKRDVVDDHIFVIELNSEMPDSPASCRFYEYYGEDDSKTRPIKPPNSKWYRYCSKDGVPP